MLSHPAALKGTVPGPKAGDTPLVFLEETDCYALMNTKSYTFSSRMLHTQVRTPRLFLPAGLFGAAMGYVYSCSSHNLKGVIRSPEKQPVKPTATNGDSTSSRRGAGWEKLRGRRCQWREAPKTETW